MAAPGGPAGWLDGQVAVITGGAPVSVPPWRHGSLPRAGAVISHLARCGGRV
jgi:hypothetical protein